MTDPPTLDDQVAAVLAAVDSAYGKPMAVGHSAACTLAWLAADARPQQVATTVLIGGFPAADGNPYVFAQCFTHRCSDRSDPQHDHPQTTLLSIDHSVCSPQMCQ